MDIGRKIYYDKQTGTVLVDIGEMSGNVKPTTIDQDISNYKVLSERVRSSFSVLELPYGAFAQDFAAASSYKVNVSTKKLIFTYVDQNTPAEPQPIQLPLSEQISALADDNSALLMLSAVQDVKISALQDENAEFMMRIAMLEMGGTPNV